jgi:hypothetical protein
MGSAQTYASRRELAWGGGLLLAALALGACAAQSAPPAASPVPITDFKMVAGRWQGLVTGLASQRDEGDTVQLTIGSDGTYDFGVYRTIGALTGKGTFTLQDGKLRMQGERGQGVYTLYEGNGRQYLRAEGALSSGMPLSAEFRRVR